MFLLNSHIKFILPNFFVIVKILKMKNLKVELRSLKW